MKDRNIITILSPALLDRYNLKEKTIIVIDVLRATSTIATILFNGAKEIIPVTDVAKCIQLGNQLDAITAGERDGKPAEGLQFGNSPKDFTPEVVKGRTVILTTTNGTKLLQMAINAGATKILTGALCNLQVICDYLKNETSDIVLACSGWKNRINIEDTLFAGAVVHQLKAFFNVQNDGSVIAESTYLLAKENPYAFMKENNASHYHRLMSFDKETDLKFCLQENTTPILSVFKDGRIIGIGP